MTTQFLPYPSIEIIAIIGSARNIRNAASKSSIASKPSIAGRKSRLKSYLRKWLMETPTEKPIKEKRPAPRPTKKGAERSQQDQIWKEILDQSLEDAMAFFFPPYHKRIDWKYPYEILDKEMMEITEQDQLHKQSADKLFKVRLRDGNAVYLLLHIEVQGYTDHRFAERVQYYHWLIKFKYKEEVRSLAILTDPNPDFRQNKVEVKDAGFRESFKFPMVKLLDYQQERKWAKLQVSKNPFAIVVMAHLQAMRLKNRPIELKEAKLQLVKMLFARGYSREYVLKLLQFIKWLVTLPPNLESQFRADLKVITTEEQMRIVSSYDQLLLDEGRQEGLEEGLQRGLYALLDVLESLLRNRFILIDEILKERLKTLNTDTLKNLILASSSFNTINDVIEWLDKHNSN